MPVSKKHADAAVGRLSGVKEGDDKIAAANKAIAVMRLAGFSASAIRKAENMRDAAIARGIK